MNETAPPTKISVQIWKPIIQKLNVKLENACLRRDAYLKKILDFELSRLDEEVSIPNSKESFDYVSKELDALDTKLVSLSLSDDLVEKMNDIFKRKMIVRDAFFNRLFLLLAASPRVIDQLLFPAVESEWRADLWAEADHYRDAIQSGFYPLEPQSNPFWAIRAGFECYREEQDLFDYVEPTSGKTIQVQRTVFDEVAPAASLYTTVFGMKIGGYGLLGLSCYLPDSAIPGSSASKKLNELLDLL
ncbi:hypothetical protein CEW83_14175 [Parazoarcus communis]|uniref:Uncharacterized protein n=1 Tax=Parazoarcus communis TaxID=41977 RepID=A0A2U8GR96_9RHOO|nr:hypothetical protein [Parazoarcus communis]AWI76219.1 hypothetical protein CEW83_14175 [Parazoarcus communis]